MIPGLMLLKELIKMWKNPWIYKELNSIEFSSVFGETRTDEMLFFVAEFNSHQNNWYSIRVEEKRV